MLQVQDKRTTHGLARTACCINFSFFYRHALHGWSISTLLSINLALSAVLISWLHSRHVCLFPFVIYVTYTTKHVVIVTVSCKQNWVRSPCKKRLFTSFITFVSFESLCKLLLHECHEFGMFYDKTDNTCIKTWHNMTVAVTNGQCHITNVKKPGEMFALVDSWTKITVYLNFPYHIAYSN